MSNIVPVILCGGSGARLRPISSLDRPKQFLRFRKSGLTLFQDTVKRFETYDRPLIVTAAQYRDEIAQQLKEINIDPLAVISEPASCNTGPAIALALHYLQRNNIKDKHMLVLPCDHILDDAMGFRHLVEKAKDVAVKNIVLFGIKPKKPMTQYGYIEAPGEGANGPVAVSSFKEKPNGEVAQSYLDAGHYYWNSGIFLMGYYAALEAFREHAPALWYQIQNLDPMNLQAEQYKNIGSKAFDRIILEYAQNIYMQHCDVNWADIGSWSVFLKYIYRFHIFK